MLKRTHSVSQALRKPGSDVARQLRELGQEDAVAHWHRPGTTWTETGEDVFAAVTRALARQSGRDLDFDGDASLVRALWFRWSALGFSRDELAGMHPALSLPQIDRRMWRSGRLPPARGRTLEGIERLALRLDRVIGATPPARRPDLRATWTSLALARLRLLAPDAVWLAAFLSQLAPEPCPLGDLTSSRWAVRTDPYRDILFDDLSLARAANPLISTGLATGDPQALELVTLPLVRRALTDEEKDVGAAAACDAMELLFPPQTYRAETWPRATFLRTHAYAAAHSGERRGTGAMRRAALLERLCVLARERGDFVLGARSGNRALTAAEECDLNSDGLADILVNYADTLSYLDRAEEAESLFRRALALPSESDATCRAATLNLYGGVLSRRADRLDEALDRQREALALVEHNEHSEAREVYAQTLHDTSLTLTRLERLAEVEELLDRAEGVAAPESETRALVRSRFASALNAHGEHRAAFGAIERALPRLELLWGRLSWPYVNALQTRGTALEAIAAETADPALAKRAERDYIAYRRLRDHLEANPTDAPGTSVFV